jgi:23S rRNA pseudouridine1911/1915/1917 synthase
MSSADRITFIVAPEDVGRRLDQVLAARVAGLSRRQARVLLDIGGVFVDGRRLKVASRPMRKGETVIAVLGGALGRATKRTGRDARARDEGRLPPYRIVHEDDELVVVDKPPGLLTAPTPESDRNNLADLLSRRPGAAGRVFVVHRIDLDTSGLVVFAKTTHANRELSERFKAHDLERRYLAVVAGDFTGRAGLISRPIAGRRAVTHVELRERIGGTATVIGCRLETGRTHQIRIHLAEEGHPVLGDTRYGGTVTSVAVRTPRPPRIALHATVLAFVHPGDGRQLSFESPLPDDLSRWLDELRRA